MKPVGSILNHPCPDCGSSMVLRNSKYGLFYGCVNYPKCKATHGAHENSGEPLGVPANKETKQARVKAHKVFDTAWKTAGIKRSYAYQLLSEKMGIDGKLCHIGMFNIDLCNEVVKVSKEIENIKEPK